MTIEEKAKAYDEVFKEAQKIHKFSNDLAEIKRMEQIFPELIDADKVIKCLINGMKFYYESNKEATWGTDKFSMKVKDIIKWLEKQLKQNSTCCNVKKETNTNNKLKFKAGDWIIRITEGLKQNIYLVTEVKDYYICEGLKGEQLTFTFNAVDNNFKLWNITDAKDGDVLVDRYSGAPFIFKGLLDKFHPDCPVAYGGIDDSKMFSISSGIGWWTGAEVYPATQKQCDFLFQKMHKAGYDWDAEKKEFKPLS